MCNNCNITPCCCSSSITPIGTSIFQIPGPPGPTGVQGIQGSMGNAGPIGSRGVLGLPSPLFSESGLFSINADGTIATGGVLSGVLPNLILTVTTIKKLLIADIHAVDETGRPVSRGCDNGTSPMVLLFTYPPLLAFPTFSSFVTPISIVSINNTFNTGYVGRIQNILATSFEIHLTRVGNPTTFTSGQWIGIMV